MEGKETGNGKIEEKETGKKREGDRKGEGKKNLTHKDYRKPPQNRLLQVIL